MLESISVDTSDLNEEKLVKRYDISNGLRILKEFYFFGGPISDTFLEKLQVCISYYLS